MSSPVFYLKYWKEFAKKHDGIIQNSHTEYREIHSAVKDPLRSIKLSIPYKNSNILFTSGESSSPLISYVFNNHLDIEFHIHKKDYIDKIQKLFGKKDFLLGNKQFDKLLSIQCKDEKFIKNIIDLKAQDFLMKYHQSLAGFQLKTIQDHSILQLQLHFDERNMETMENVLDFLRNLIDRIFLLEFK